MQNLSSTLLESPELLKAILNHANDGIIVIDMMGVIRMVNPAVTRLFQYSKKELLGQKINLLMNDEDREHHDQYMRAYYETGDAKIIGIGRQVQGRKKNGVLFPARLSVSEIKAKSYRLFIGLIHDVSQSVQEKTDIRQMNAVLEERVEKRTSALKSAIEKLTSINGELEAEIEKRKNTEALLKKSEAEIMQSLNKEKELNALKKRFVTTASHEFRTPLSTILSSTALLNIYNNADATKSKQVDKHLVKIRSAVNYLTHILEDFLSLTNLEEEKIESRPELFYVNEFCESVLQETETWLKVDQRIDFQQLVPDEQVFTDKRLLKNVLLNLLSNAIKFSPANKIIFLKIEQVDEGINFTIKDEGIGIPEADQAYLFERFFRAENVANIQGTGLGLNIVKRYLDLLNGKIEFKSESQVGSLFKITIPKTVDNEKQNISH